MREREGEEKISRSKSTKISFSNQKKNIYEEEEEEEEREGISQ